MSEEPLSGGCTLIPELELRFTSRRWISAATVTEGTMPSALSFGFFTGVDNPWKVQNNLSWFPRRTGGTGCREARCC